MSTRPKTTYLTPAEYLAIERQAETKSEYLNGEVFLMSGATRKHNLIGTNLTREISQRLRNQPCETYANDMRVLIPATGLYAYPDLVVVCGEPQFEDAELDTLLNPTLVVEVLSKSAASYDRGDKFNHYRSVPALSEYLLVAQDEYKFEHYVKQSDDCWVLTDIRGLEAQVKLTSINCVLPLSEAYLRIKMDEPSASESKAG
ncbi:MAG: Uma2 family endonuclease [Pyrinomonadaceae bacterium]